MLQHVVVFTWREGVTDADVTALTEQLRALPAQVPALLAYSVGPDAGLRPGNADFAVVARVADEAGLVGYLEHPAHLEAVVRVNAMVATRTAVQVLLP